MAKRKKTATKKKRAIPFVRMTPAQKRVAIARDVIAQLDVEKIRAAGGAYFEAPELCDLTPNKQVRDVLKGMTRPCRVCARGAIFVAAVKRHDKLTVKDVMPHVYCPTRRSLQVQLDDLGPYNDQFFSKEQTVLIESAFEQCEMFTCSVGQAAREKAPVAARMYSVLWGPEKRMRAIMKNIIRNRGTFKIDDKVDMRAKRKAEKFEEEIGI